MSIMNSRPLIILTGIAALIMSSFVIGNGIELNQEVDLPIVEFVENSTKEEVIIDKEITTDVEISTRPELPIVPQQKIDLMEQLIPSPEELEAEAKPEEPDEIPEFAEPEPQLVPSIPEASTEPETDPVPDSTTELVIPGTTTALDMIALIIYQEAGGNACSDETRLMVGQTVLNRVADDRFPNTIEEVLLQESQYGRLCWTGLVWPSRHSNPGEADAVKRAYECAERVLGGEKLLPDDSVWQAGFPQGKETLVISDGMYFCR